MLRKNPRVPFWRQDTAQSDPRILMVQLTLVARSARLARLAAPVWGLVVALLSSYGAVGHVPAARSLVLPLVLSFAVAMCALAMSAWDRFGGAVTDARKWFVLFVATQILVSGAWGLMPWLCWEPGNVVNHLFLATGTMAVLAGLVVVRGSNMVMFGATIMPLVAIGGARFLLGDLPIDRVIGFVAPFVALQLWITGAPLVQRLAEDARLRFKVEDLARELEDTRDEALEKRFEAESANASKTAFLANMSHELRTPLNAILGFSEIISQECFGPVGNERYRDYAGDIHSSGAHLLSLINDLLDVAKIEAGKMDIVPHPLDAAHTFDIALKLIGTKAREKDQMLAIAVDDKAPKLWADERAVKQILINLVSNAVKFTPKGGRIEVIGGRAANGDFQILVRDNGPGIPADKVDKIFSPFNQVDNRFDRQAGGTGLGLALVKGLAELHGGRAWIESEFGHGCSVFVTLPVKRANTAVVAA